jgi:hypothetical protein
VPEAALQVAWNKVSLDYPPGHAKAGQSVILARDALLPDWVPADKAQLYVTIGALRRVVLVETEDEMATRLAVPETVAGKLGDLVAARTGPEAKVTPPAAKG